MKVGDLVRAPDVGGDFCDRSRYSWEGQIGIVIGFRHGEDDFVEVAMQNTGRLCTFSIGTLETVGDDYGS